MDAGLVDIAGNESTSTWGSTFATNYAGWSEYPPRMGSMVPPNEYGSTFPCNLNPTVYFTQVMNPDTFWYGYTVSIYDLDSAELVPATLQVDWRKMVIVPDEPLEPSRRYRLEITDELRSVADRPLDTNYDYLAGGGPFWRDWVATGPSSDIVLFLTATPIADTDGNGYYDYDESPAPQNQIEILSELVMWPSYVSGEMISYVRGLKYDANDQPYLDIELSNGIVLFATSTTMGIPNIDDDDDDFDDDDFDRDREKIPGDSGPLGMGPITIDVFEPGSAPVVKGMDGQPQMNISMNTYFTVGNGLINALLVNELGLEQTGRLYFAADGRMEVIITGRADIELLGGVMALPSEVTMRAVSEPQY